jgi:hypothetical protein
MVVLFCSWVFVLFMAALQDIRAVQEGDVARHRGRSRAMACRGPQSAAPGRFWCGCASGEREGAALGKSGQERFLGEGGAGAGRWAEGCGPGSRENSGARGWGRATAAAEGRQCRGEN